MAKPRHHSPSPPESSPRGMLAILAIGALLVAGLVVWALTRTVETPDTAMTSTTETTVATATTAIDTGTTPPVDTVPRGFNTPLAPTTTAGITTTSNAQPSEANFPRISAEDLREKMKTGAVTVLDVRPPLAYEGEHIAGSLSMAVASVEASLDLLPADKSTEIVTYCTCPAEESSIAAGLILNKHGYNKVSALFGGLDAWRNLRYPIERGAPK